MHRFLPALGIAMILVLTLAFTPAHAAEQPGLVASTFIYDEADFAQCHASTIEQTKHGLVAAWFGGPHEKHPTVAIYSARQVDGKWSPPQLVATGVQYTRPDGSVHRHPCWNPVLFQPREGPLMLFYKVGPDPSKWWGMLTTSTDGGKTWSQPARLPEQIDGPVKNKPIQLADGTILCGSSTEDSGWRVHFESTRDLGKTWQRTEAVNDGKAIGAIQPSILELGGQKLLALGRTRQGKVFQVASDDLGKTWSTLSLTQLPNPNAGTDAVTLKDGRHLLVYNPTSRGRSPLAVVVSEDGKTWQGAHVLEDQPGEYSYPAVIQDSEGKVQITYTYQRKKVKHVTLDPAKLKLVPLVDGQWPEGK